MITSQEEVHAILFSRRVGGLRLVCVVFCGVQVLFAMYYNVCLLAWDTYPTNAENGLRNDDHVDASSMSASLGDNLAWGGRVLRDGCPWGPWLYWICRTVARTVL